MLDDLVGVRKGSGEETPSNLGIVLLEPKLVSGNTYEKDIIRHQLPGDGER